MTLLDLEKTIDAAFEDRASINAQTKGAVRDAVEHTLNLLDSGQLRVAEKQATGWHVNAFAKKAVLLSFRLNENRALSGGPDSSVWWDKVGIKFSGWSEDQFKQAGFRSVPGTVVRKSAFVAPNAILMPCFINVGAYVDEGTMIDTWSTVGSCAQVGKNCHISGGVGLGGVLEPLQANPVIIEDNVFVGARSEVAEGVIVGEGAVLSMGCYIGASTKIINRATGEIHMGKVPPYSVCVPGALPGKPLPDGQAGPSLACVVIVKTVDAQTRSKTGINELLRD